jgi:hypothetical protein
VSELAGGLCRRPCHSPRRTWRYAAKLAGVLNELGGRGEVDVWIAGDERGKCAHKDKLVPGPEAHAVGVDVRAGTLLVVSCTSTRTTFVSPAKTAPRIGRHELRPPSWSWSRASFG